MDLAQPSSGIGSRFAAVRGQPMHYREGGAGAPVVFLHGNPTSSYLWRNILPLLVSQHRCVALDLIGMGRSGKPAISYRLRDHIAYVEGFLDALGLTDITFVLHDWGVAIGLDYLRRFPERVRAVAFMEGHLHPIDRWTDFDPAAREMFQRLRTEDVGRRLIVDENFFVETVLPSGVLRTLSPEEMDAYRAPFPSPEDRAPLWRWPQEIPIAGEPADVATLLRANQTALARSPIAKLLLYAHPGAVIGPTEVAWCRSTLTNLTAVDLGEGIHFLPEDHPTAIGQALTLWLDRQAG